MLRYRLPVSAGRFFYVSRVYGAVDLSWSQSQYPIWYPYHIAAYPIILHSLGLVEAVLLMLMLGLWMHDSVFFLQCDGDSVAHFLDIHNLKAVQ